MYAIINDSRGIFIFMKRENLEENSRKLAYQVRKGHKLEILNKFTGKLTGNYLYIHDILYYKKKNRL